VLEGFDGPRTISSVFANIAGLSGGGDGGGDPAGGDAGGDAEGAAPGAAPPALRSLGKLKVRRAGRTPGGCCACRAAGRGPSQALGVV